MNAEIVQLQNNLITEISPGSFQHNLKITFLSLQKNKILRIENLLHLENLEMLDLSNNEIEEVDTEQLPPNLLALKLIGNPVHTRSTKTLSKYRKPIVLHL